MSDMSNGYPPQPQPPHQPGGQPGFGQPPFGGGQPGPGQPPYGYPQPPAQGYQAYPGNPMNAPAYAAMPVGGGVKYDAAGKPRYPGPYLAAIIVLSVGFAFAVISIIQTFSLLDEVAAYVGENHAVTGKMRLLVWLTLATMLINLVAFIAIVLGMAWGRIVYTAVFIVNVIVTIVIVSGVAGLQFWSVGNLLPLVLPILVNVLLWVPISTQYLKAMNQWRARRRPAGAF